MNSRRHTLTLRRAIVLVVVLGLLGPALLINGYFALKQYSTGIRTQTEELLQQNADIIANGMQEPLWNSNPESGEDLVAAMMQRNEDIVRIEVRNNTLGLFVSMEKPERRRGFTAFTDKPVLYHGSTIGSVRVEVTGNRLRDKLAESIEGSTAALLAQVALSIALIFLVLDRRLIRPLERLEVGAERLANRELDVPFTWDRLDEIGMLGRRMEDTRISLRNLFEELDQKNLELERDINERKRIEQELHERKERYRTLVDQSPIAIIEWDSQYTVVEWNDAAERIFGYPREHALGRYASFIMTSPDAEAINLRLQQITSGPYGGRNITRNRRADGRIITCQWIHNRVVSPPGQADRFLSIAEDITEKRRAEEALLLSEAKFANAFQGNPDSISISRMSDGTLIDVNQAFTEVTGHTRSEAVGKTAAELQLWAVPHQRKGLLRELEAKQKVRNYEWDMRTSDGRVRKCLTNATAFSVGEERYLLAVIRDVTERRLLEEQKAEADRALLRLAQGTRDIAGESFFELLVADLCSALGTDCAFISLCMSTEPGTLRTLAVRLHGQSIENFQYAYTGTPCERTLDGELVVYSSGLAENIPGSLRHDGLEWESYAGAPLRDAAGNAIGVLAVMHSGVLRNPDLVKSLLQVFSERASAELERKRAEEELRASEQRFSTIFQSSPIAMFVTQVRGNYIVKDVNQAFEQLFMRPRDTVIGRTTLDLGLYSDPADRASLIAELKATDTTKNQREVWMCRGDGSQILVQFAGHAFSLDGERFGILACADVTDKRRIENEILQLNTTLEQRVIERTEELQQANRELAYTVETLNKAQDELVRSEKLAALGLLVAGIAHELNTPIGNSLLVASTLFDQTRELSKSYRANELKRSALESYISDAGTAGDILVRNLQRAAHLVNSFKQVAVDQTSSHRRKFSLAEVVSEIMLTMWPTLKKTAFIVKQNIPESLEMDSYPGPLGQVITNLVNNALLHGFDGRQTGTVTIEADTSSPDWVSLIISDDGIGIPASNLNRIFDPFFTTRLGAGGSGLGLNITHNVVTGVLGGRIQVHSEVGIGTTFFLSLPLVAPFRQYEDELSPRNAA